jgi:hypothetical protein
MCERGRFDPPRSRDPRQDYGHAAPERRDTGEIEFLMSGRRVELNAMTSRQMVEFVERKLNEHGIKKIVPTKEKLDEAYRLFTRGKLIEKAVEEAIAVIGDDPIEIPGDLEERVREHIEENPSCPWDEAVAAVATDKETE